MRFYILFSAYGLNPITIIYRYVFIQFILNRYLHAMFHRLNFYAEIISGFPEIQKLNCNYKCLLLYICMYLPDGKLKKKRCVSTVLVYCFSTIRCKYMY